MLSVETRVANLASRLADKMVVYWAAWKDAKSVAPMVALKAGWMDVE